MSRRHHLVSLRATSPLVLPSLLSCDFGNLEQEVRRLEDAEVSCLHLDVMDGHFVPNLSIGLPIVEAVRRTTNLPLDVHLMIANPDSYLQQFYDAGADIITIHAEAMDDPRPLLRKIHALGAGAGLAINPPTPVETIQPVLDLCDLVLVMSVMPGFGGQTFDRVALEKLRQLKSLVGERVLLEVDGGVNAETIAECSQAGAQLMVAGTAIFYQTNYLETVATLTQLAVCGV